ncbi:MAG: hypothetical protein ABI416_04620 [Ginsengibacter sp.]
MASDEEKKNTEKDDQSEEVIKSDPETLHTTDPQEHMEGPISSIMHKLGEGFDDKDAPKEKEEKNKTEEK